MKTNRAFALMVVLAALSGTKGHCGIKLTSGSLDFLKQENQVNVEYNYDGMTVRPDKKEVPEKDYIARKVAEFDQKDPGRGELWRQRWFSARAAVYEPKFCDALNQRLSARKIDLHFGSFKQAKYTLIVQSPADAQAQQSALEGRRAALAAKALKYQEEQAATGDSYSQWHLGVRYRDGDGVPKDLTKARAWLKKSTAQGNPNAKRDLDMILAQ